MDVNFTFVHKRASTVIQFVVALLTGLASMFLFKIVGAESEQAFLGAFIGIVFFTLINTVVSIAHESYLSYTVPSYGLYLLLVAILLLSAKKVSGISIWDLEVYRMMLTSVTIFYMVASTLVRVMRYVYEEAEKDF